MGDARISVDYLVIGSGAAGMAFTDALVTHAPDAEVALVDRRAAPGGHWNDAYDFCRLHQASAFYGVDSVPLGQDAIDAAGLNRGGHERATAAEIRGYYQRVLDTRLLPTGRVRHLPMSEHTGNGTVVSRVSGRAVEVHVRRKLVDAQHLAPTIPVTTPPPFEVAADAVCIPVNDLTGLDHPSAGYVVVGGGKTAMDAILWLLEHDTDPDAIRWVKPREQWLTNRAFYEPLTRAWTGLESASYYAEAGARAATLDEFYALLEQHRVLVRVDEDVAPTMAHAPTINDAELDQLRRVHDVVRLGRVRRIGADVIELDGGTVPTSPDHVHVHCAASGTPRRPPRPVFADDRITLQSVRWSQPCLSAALTGYLEATRDDIDEKNRLCPPHAYPDRPVDWAATVLHSLRLDVAWAADADVEAFTYGSRLNPVRGWKDQLEEPRAKAAIHRLVANLADAMTNLEELVAEHQPA